jgi:hypothetical protein
MVLRSVDIRPRIVSIAPSAWRSRWFGSPDLGRRAGVVAAVLLVLVSFGSFPATAAAAEPDPITFEGGTREMREQLAETQSAWLDAKAALDASIKRQQELTVSLESVRERMDVQTARLGKVAHVAFITAGFNPISGVIGTGTAEEFLEAMGIIDALATKETNMIRELRSTQSAANAAQDSIEQEILTQEALYGEMETRKQEAQLALCRDANGRCPETAGFTSSASYVAKAAPRNRNGSWPVESRTVYEPHSGGRITPRLAHARDQARAAGFNIYEYCYRAYEDGGQHPRGRACDFQVDRRCRFCGAASGAAKRYGDDLAMFYVFNAERLGVLYIIWYQQIWTASSGRWRYYSGCCGSSQRHTNHVHLSVK